MKNLNLTDLFLAMVAKFGVSGFELSSIIPKNAEPIDAHIRFKDATVIEEDITEINEIIYEYITGEVKQVVVKLNDGTDYKEIIVYIEFINSEFLDTLD